ncbi:hypothetical protein [Anaerofustis stercorihominis]|uniref:hypothetical protein n=1 Tax=Anaerofustis stercorihominis TaxID=214853 RepID=UPI001105C0FB|nr:hypothetical protein [Anaerofustis stercorihominis]
MKNFIYRMLFTFVFIALMYFILSTILLNFGEEIGELFFSDIDEEYCSDIKVNSKKFYWDFENEVEYPELNESREILKRLFGEDWIEICYKNITIEPTLNDNDTDTGKYEDGEDFESGDVTLKVYACNYGKVYKNAKEKTDKQIKEKNIKNKKEKNDLLNKNLKEEYRNVMENDKITENIVYKNMVNKSVGRYSGIDMSIAPLRKQNGNMDLYSALTGGLVYEIEKNPCDYLIVSDEFKYYEELKGLIEDVKTDIVKGDLPSDYEEAREVMSTFADPTGDKEKDIEVAFRSVGFSIEKIDRDKKKIKLIFDSPDYEKIYNRALEETINDIESEEKYLTEGEKGEIFTENLYRNYVDMSTKTRVDPKKKTTITYETYYDENGECHYKLNIDDDFYSYFFGNLEKAVGSEADYMIFEREKPPEKKKGPDIVKEMMEEEENNK